MDFFSSLKTFVLDMLFPEFCAGCGTEGLILCSSCRETIRMIPPACFVCKKLVPANGLAMPGKACKPCRRKTRIYAYLSPFAYEAAIRKLIHALKYRRMRAASPILAELLHAYLTYHEIHLPADSILIPVPLHKRRERIRGFNQSRLIADLLGKKLGIKAASDILQKIKATTAQMELSGTERRANLKGAFAVSDTGVIRNRTCILIDDVKTTGTTLEEAARVLNGAGAKRIWAITVAH